jgi:hypothetical protein
MTELKAHNPSLIQGENQQLKLFDSTEMPDALFATEETAEQREYTGARLFAKDPERYKAVVALSGEGLGVLRIGKILNVSPHTVMAVRAREPECVAIEKSRIAGLSREAGRMCVEGILELLCDPEQRKKMGIKELSISFGILAEKHELLSGAPTARIQTVGDPTAVGILEHMRWAKEEYERRMGCGAGKTEQRTAAEADSEADEDQDRPTIGTPGPAPRRPIALLEAPKCSVGQTPHRIDETPVNIDRNQVTDPTSNNVILPKVISASDEDGNQK